MEADDTDEICTIYTCRFMVTVVITDADLLITCREIRHCP